MRRNWATLAERQAYLATRTRRRFLRRTAKKLQREAEAIALLVAAIQRDSQ